jgi:2-methylcitrate dehydratase PrpD
MMGTASEISRAAAEHTALWKILDDMVGSITSRPLEAIAPRTIEHVSLVFADTVGVMLAGRRYEPARRLATEIGGNGGRAQLVVGEGSGDAIQAALINGTCGTVPELDELIIGGGVGGHPGMHIGPAVVAVAQETGATGADLLRSFLVGYEVTARLFQWFDLDPRVQPHGHLGTIGAAAAVAQLIGADPAQACRVSSAMPLLALWDTTLEGASVHYSYTGLSASLGILAARMAEAGFTGPTGALGTCFAELVGRPAAGFGKGRADDDEWLIEANFIKSMASCGRNFPAMDAALKIRDVDIASIDRIVVEADALAGRLSGAGSVNELTTKFSLEYAVAAVLVHGKSDAGIFGAVDPIVSKLMDKVSVTVSQDRGGALDQRSAQVVVVDDKGTHVGESVAAAGYWCAPLDATWMERKFVEMVAPVHAGPASELFRRLRGVADLDDISKLW